MKKADSLTHKAKRRKLTANGDVGTAKELNDLPEAILLHILSFLPIRDAVKTSVLSKRWQYLWPCMPKLEFHVSAWKKASTACFLNIIDRAFAIRGLSSIDTFSLEFTPKDDATRYRLRTWIAGAVSHKVRKLSLRCPPNDVPSCVYMCETLTELHLDMTLIGLPSSICLSNLKVLQLNILNPIDGISLQKLFSLPSLEVLILHCSLKDSKAISITAPKLRKLSFQDCSFRYDVSHGFKVLIDGSSLQSFEYSGRLFYDLCISAANVLVTANVDIWDPFALIDRGEQFGKLVHKLLTGLSNARFLTLPSIAVEALCERSELIDSLPLFSNLKVLKFQSQCFSFDCPAPLAILTRFPCLESLQFEEGIKLAKRIEKRNSILDPVPPCFLSELKKITIRNLTYANKGMRVFRELLREARVLKEMVIHCSYSSRKNQKKDNTILKALKALPRRSEDCNFIVQSGF